MKPKNLLIGISVCTFLLVAIVFALWNYKENRFGQSQLKSMKAPTDVIMRVGNEDLYQKDLDFELSKSPQKDDPQIKQALIDKMITDSIILQGAESDHLLTLDSTIYNNVGKDYLKRIQTVEDAKVSIDSNTDSITGFVVSIWYHNNNWIGPAGLEASKQMAYEKLKKLHDQVAANQITIQQAGEMIKNDTSIAKLDKAYKGNAILQFESLKGSNKPITLNKDLDNRLWALRVGETTDIYPGQATDLVTGEKYDALYYFGQLTNRTSPGGALPLDQWLESKKKIYQVMYY